MTTVRFIQDSEALAALCEELREAPFLAIDTEFERIRTYYPRLCLLQVASTEALGCIDPLGIEDLSPFWELLSQPGSTKVLHAGRQDVELFYQSTGSIPAPLFDTQIAAAMLGYDEQIGYASLVEKMLDVHLDKGQTRTDWARRPLSDAQLAYAADDVRYLVRLYQALAQKLQARGRLEWAQGDSQGLTRTSLYEVDPALAWKRVKGAGRLSGRRLKAIKTLAHWRESEAMSRNRPRQWIVRDEYLQALASRTITRPGDVAAIEGIPVPVVKRYSNALVELLGDLGPDSGDGEARRRPSASADDRLKSLQAHLRSFGEANDISPSLLATRRELQKLLEGERELPVLSGWRYELVGQALLQMAEDAPAS